MSTRPDWCMHHTDKEIGFRMVMAPPQCDLEYIHYGRVRLDGSHPREELATGGLEFALLAVSGAARLEVGGASFRLGKLDTLYVPCGRQVAVECEGACDLILGAASSTLASEPVLVRWADIKDDPARYFDVGDSALGTQRRIYNVITTDIKAERLLFGFTFGTAGAWTSWPPHEHAATKEEIYVFFDMPAPAFAVQFVYTNPARMEVCEPVREGSAVAVPRGYHPTAVAPGFKTTFAWMMAARNPKTDRDFKSGIHVQEDYAAVRFL
ncbi:5-deoxy-glucuronate isomerase [bacterium]|nr:5-deoxy-glucuronate isomerase [bacterium]